MRRQLPLLWLGLRLCVGSGRGMLLRSVLLGSVCSLGVFLVLSAMAVPVVADAQRTRNQSRTPIVESDRPAGLAIVTHYDSIDGRPLRRMAVADAERDSPRPPGIATFPEPGEMVLSPALIRLMAEDESIPYRFPQRLVGEVGPAGLVAPDELVAYVGVPRSEMSPGVGVVVGYRNDPADIAASSGTHALERLLTPANVVPAVFALFLVLPLSVLLAICVRFDASRRDRRLAALRLVGLSRRQVHLSASVEMAVTATVGVGLGLALFHLIAPLSEGWQIGRFHWYADDIDLSAGQVVVFSILMILLAVGVSFVGGRTAIRSPLRTRRGGATSRSFWRLVPLFLAPLALLIATSGLLTPVQQLILLGIGLVAIVIALTTATPLILALVGAAATRVRRLPVWALLAARRAVHAPAITPKLVTTLLVAIFIAGLGMLVGSTIRADNPLLTGSSGSIETVQAFDVPREVADRLRSAPSVAELSVSRRAAARVAEPAGSVAVVWISCHDLAQLLDLVDTCHDDTAYRVEYADGMRPPVPDAGTALSYVDAASSDGPAMVPPAVLRVAGDDRGCQCDIVMTKAPDWGDLTIEPTVDAATFWRDAARLAPGIHFQGPLKREKGFDTSAVLTLISVGLTLTVALGLIGFVVASIDRGVEARHRDAPLLAIGVPGSVLRRAEAAQLLVVVVSGLLLVVGFLALTTRSWAAVFDMSLTSVVEPLVPLFLSVVGGLVFLVLGVLALTTQTRALTAQDLRRE